MTLLVLYKLLAMVATIGVGWLALRLNGLVPEQAQREGQADAAQVLGNATLYLFVPALLFRTVVRQDLAALPLRTLAAYFVPTVLYMLAVYGWQRWRERQARRAPSAEPAAAAPPGGGDLPPSTQPRKRQPTRRACPRVGALQVDNLRPSIACWRAVGRGPAI